MREVTIVSGGQTGADRAALDAALDARVSCGGWCPGDRSAEDGAIPERYPLRPLPGGGNDQRTRANVRDSDGTVIFCFGEPAGGTDTTRRACVEMNKPLLIIDAAGDPASAARDVRDFMDANTVRVLNVAGPRASEEPAIGAFVYRCVRALLRDIAS